MLWLIFGLAILIGTIVGIVNIAAAKSANDPPVSTRIISITKQWQYSTIVFELSNKERIALNVYDSDARTMIVGDSGMLEYHNSVFKSFIRTDSASAVEAVG